MHCRFALIPLAASLAAMCGAAHSQALAPFYVGVAQGISSEDGGTGPSNTVSATSLRAGVDTPLGRGRAYADGALTWNRYDPDDAQNNRSHDLRAGLDWATVGTLSGGLVGSSVQRLSRLQLPSGVARSIERTNDADAVFRLGVAGPLGIEAGLGARDVSYSAPELDAREYQQRRGRLGVTYRVGGALTLGLGANASNDEYERFSEPVPGSYLADKARRREGYVSAVWVPTAKSTLSGRLNGTRIKHSVDTARNFSGVTGTLSWGWRPTGKLRFTTALARDTGEEAALITPTVVAALPGTPGIPVLPEATPTPTDPSAPAAGITPLTSSGSTVNQASIHGVWEATPKINVNAGVSVANHKFALPTTPDTKVTTLSLGARWVPTRNWTLGCDLRHESGDSDARSIGCTGQFLLR